MAYTQDKSGTIIVNGFQNGIADSPFDGISDMRNVNLISIPGEASVNFSTSSNVDANATGSVVSANAGADTISISGANIQQGQAVTFSGGSLPGGIVVGTVYWAVPTGGGVYNLYTNYAGTSLLDITSNGTGTYTTVTMSAPKYFTHLATPYVDTYFMVDSSGKVWNYGLSSPSNWRYTGNTVTGTNGSAHGNGLCTYVPSDSGSTAIGYVFVFRDFQIDYATITSNSTLTWTYGWKPSTGATGQNNYLKNASTGANNSLIHEAFTAPDNRVYYCDANWIGRWYQTSPTTGFDPTNTATYTFDQTPLLPFTDTAQCLTFLGTNILVGGKNNMIYPWDRYSTNPNQYIQIAESNIVKMVTINTTTYIFVGNRGRIYYTNGSQAQLYKKLPDHLSGTVEPYYVWGGATSSKNQLYFSASVTTNAGVAITTMGGLWAIDLDSKAQRLTNKLSYATYAGYATALISNFGTNPAGTGLYIGWDSGVSTYGIDTTIGTPYTGSQAYVDSDLIPIGTFLKPVQSSQVEYKLTAPMVAGESVSMYYRLQFTDAYTLIFTKTTAGTFSGNSTESTTSLNFGAAQWLQIRTVINSTVSSPSYTRLKEFRISQNG